MRCDSDDEIVPIVSGRAKKGFTPVRLIWVAGWLPGGGGYHSSSARMVPRPLALPTNQPQKEYEQLKNPKLLGGATIGDELALIRKQVGAACLA